MQIEHDPREPKIDRSNTVYWVAWAIVVLKWLGLWYGEHRLDWASIAAGGFTMAVLIITVTETSRKPPR